LLLLSGCIYAWSLNVLKKKAPKKKYNVKGFTGTVTAFVDTGTYIIVGYETGALVAWEATDKEASPGEAFFCLFFFPRFLRIRFGPGFSVPVFFPHHFPQLPCIPNCALQCSRWP
jgi:hypothetical protein